MEKLVRIEMCFLQWEKEKVVSEPVQKAIAYLTTWSYGVFSKVYIHNEGNDIYASYQNEKGDRLYLIAAIFDNEKGVYSFHS